MKTNTPDKINLTVALENFGQTDAGFFIIVNNIPTYFDAAIYELFDFTFTEKHVTITIPDWIVPYIKFMDM